MGGRHDHHQPVPGHGDRVQATWHCRRLDEAHVAGPRHNPLAHRYRVLHVQVHRYLGVGAAELTQPAWHQMLGDGHAGADRQLGGPPDLQAVRDIEQLGGAGQHLARPVHEHRPLRGQGGPRRAAHQQRQCKPAFEPLDRSADVRLRHADAPAGGAEAAELLDADQQLQGLEIRPVPRHLATLRQ